MKHTTLLRYIKLYAGGVCQQSEGSNDCKDKGLTVTQELKMDVMVFSSDPHRYAELAVIQLKKDINIVVCFTKSLTRGKTGERFLEGVAEKLHHRSGDSGKMAI